MQSYKMRRLVLATIIAFCLVLIGLNLFLDINVLDTVDIIIDLLLIGAIIVFLILQSKYNLLCKNGLNCLYMKEESERYIEEIKKHLGEQRHDFLNVMQILYGYTQLKKPDKIIDYIKCYSKKIENLGKIYNMKNIKFADMLYNMERESDSLGIGFNIYVETPDFSHVSVLEDEMTIYAVRGIINNYFYLINEIKNSKPSLCLKLMDTKHKIIIQLHIEEEVEEDKGIRFSTTGFFSDIIGKDIPSIDSIKEVCSKQGIDFSNSDDYRKVELSIVK